MRLIAYCLLLVGVAIMGWGLQTAFGELITLYSELTNDVMNATSLDDESAVPDRMLRAALIGAVGIVPFVVGLILLLKAKIARRRTL